MVFASLEDNLLDSGPALGRLLWVQRQGKPVYYLEQCLYYWDLVFGSGWHIGDTE